MRGFLQRTIKSISTPFEGIFDHDSGASEVSRFMEGSTSPKTISRLGDTQDNLTCPYAEAQTQTSTCSSPHRVPGRDISGVTSTDARSASGEEDHEAEEPRFVEGPNRIVVIHDGNRNSLLFALTEETVSGILEMIRATRAFAPIASRYEELCKTIRMNEARIELIKRNLEEDGHMASNRKEVAGSLEEREEALHRDVECKSELEREVQFRRFKLKLLQEESQERFEQILTEANLLELPASEITEMEDRGSHTGSALGSHSPNSPIPEPEEPTISPEETEATAIEMSKQAEAVAARQEYDEASHWARSAEQQFMERQQAYEQDILEYGSTASRTEIDLFHVQRGRDLAKNLNEAEDAWEKARVRAKALGVLSNNSYQESNFVDDAEDGYRLSQDPSGKVIKPAHGTIEVWADGVAQGETGDDGPMPDVDDWDTETIGPYDSVSVVAEPRQRTRIDRWRSLCEATVVE